MIEKDNSSPSVNTENSYVVTARDLPLSCPMPNMALWNAHPKVFLPIEETGQAKCPYCGTDYVLADWSGHAAHH